MAQRVFAIACGHPDGIDGDRLADDPIHKLLLGRDPLEGGRLASQPTISRFEHTAAPRMLLAMSHALADTMIARHRRRRRRVRLIRSRCYRRPDPRRATTHLLQWLGPDCGPLTSSIQSFCDRRNIHSVAKALNVASSMSCGQFQTDVIATSASQRGRICEPSSFDMAPPVSRINERAASRSQPRREVCQLRGVVTLHRRPP